MAWSTFPRTVIPRRSQAQGRKDEAQRGGFRHGSRIGTRHIQFDGQPHRVGGLEDSQLLMGMGRMGPQVVWDGNGWHAQKGGDLVNINLYNSIGIQVLLI